MFATLAVAGLSTLAAQSQDKSRPERQHSLSLGDIKVSARLALDNTPEHVRAFVDDVFTVSPITTSVPESIKLRIYNSELGFRQGHVPAVSEAALLRELNDEAARFDMPEYATITQGQLRQYRKDLSYFTKSFSDISQSQKDQGDYSPAEALFVVADLALQKAANPEFQVSPAQWEREASERRARIPRRTRVAPIIGEIKVHVLSKPAAVILPTLTEEMTDQIAEVHNFLDRVGLAR